MKNRNTENNLIHKDYIAYKDIVKNAGYILHKQIKSNLLFIKLKNGQVKHEIKYFNNYKQIRTAYKHKSLDVIKTYMKENGFNLGDTLEMSSGVYFDKMTFGDERLFYGNLRTYIGATIYKTLFNINVDGATISSSSNPTFDEGEDRFISEVGILDGQQNLVLVGKLSRPIKISNSSTASIELTIDF